MVRALAAACGVAADMLAGEPPVRPHPVAAFGTLMEGVERTVYQDSRGAGVVHAVIGAGAGAAVGAALTRAGGRGPATALAAYVAVAHKQLGLAAREVGDVLERGDLEEARRLLPALVGRDPSGLGEKEIARAVVESVAENTVDAVVAPALWAAVGGAPLALAYRAVNTMDAMVGHRNRRHLRYGWAAARLDDAANLVPARATAGLVAAARPTRAAEVWRAVRCDARGHPSPNAGVAEAAFVAALGLRLGGTNRYGDRVEFRPSLGSGRAPEGADIEAAVTLGRDVARLLVVTLAGVGIGARRVVGRRAR